MKSSTSIAISCPHSLVSDFKSSLPGQISEEIHQKHPMAKTSTLLEDQDRDLSPIRPKKGRVVALKDHYGFDSFSKAEERTALDEDCATFKPPLPAKPLTSNIAYQTGSGRPGLVSEDDDCSKYVVETRHTGSLSASVDYSESVSKTSRENKSSNTEISIKELIQRFSTKDKHTLAGKTSTSDDFIISNASSTTNLRKEDENGSGKLKSNTSIAISRPHSLASDFKSSLAGQTSEGLHQKYPMAKTSTLLEDQDRDLSPKRPKKGRVVALKDHYGLDSFSEAKERIASDKDKVIFKPPLPAKPLTSNIGYQTGSRRPGLVSEDDDGSKYGVETRHTGSLSGSMDYSESLSETSEENKSSNTEISIKEPIQRFSTNDKHMLARKTSTSDDFIISNASSSTNLRKEEENGSGKLKSNTSIAVSRPHSLASDFKSSLAGQTSEGLHQKHPMAKTSTLLEDQDQDLSQKRPKKGRVVALKDHYGFDSFSEAKERIASDKDKAIFKPPLPAKPLTSNIGYQTGSGRPGLVSEDDDGSKYVVETRHTGSLSGSMDYSESPSETSEENKSSNTEISIKELIQRFSTKDKHMLARKTSTSDDFIISNISSSTNLRKEDENGSGTLKSCTSIAISCPHSLASDFKSSLPGQISEELHQKHPMAKTSTLLEDQDRDLSPIRPKKGRVVALKDHYGFDSFSKAEERTALDEDCVTFKPPPSAKPLTSNIAYQTGSGRPGLVSEDDDCSKYVVETRHTGSLSASVDYSESVSKTSRENKSSNTEISIKELIQRFSTKDKHTLAGKTSTSDDFIISNASSTTNLRKEDENGSGKLKSNTSIAISRPHSLASDFKSSLAGQTSEGLHQKYPMAKTSTLLEDQDRDLSPKRPKKGRVVALKDHYGFDSFSKAEERTALDEDCATFKPPLPAKPLTSNIGYQTGSGRPGLVSEDDDGSKYVVEAGHTGSLSGSMDYSESLSETSGENKSSNTEISIKELIQRFSTKDKHMLAGKTSTSDDFIISNAFSITNLRKEDENGSGTLKSSTSIVISRPHSLASDFKSSLAGQTSEGLHQKHPMAKTSTLLEDQDRDLFPKRPKKGRVVELKDHYGFDSFSEAKEMIAPDKDYAIFKPPLLAKPLTSNIGYQTGSGRPGLVSKDDDGSKYVVETRHTGSLSGSVDNSESLSETSGKNKSSNTEISIKELIRRFSTKDKHMLVAKTSTTDDFIISNTSSTMNLRKEDENGSGTLKSNTSIAISHSLSLPFANEMPPNFATKDVHFTKRAISFGDINVNDEVEFQLDTRNEEKPSAKRIWSLKDINDNNQNDKDMKDETFGTIDRGISGGSKRRKSVKEDRLIKDEGNSVSGMEDSTMNGQAEQLSLDQSSEKKSSSKYGVKQTDRADEMEPLSRSRGNTSWQSNTQNRADSIGASMQQQIYGRICSLKDRYGFIRPSDKLPEDYPQSKVTKNDLILNSTPEKQVIAFQDRVITINIKEAQHPLK